MTPEQARSILVVVATAHDRTVPAGLDEIWAATLADIPYELGRTAALEVLKGSAYLPKVAEIRERARLIKAEHDRTNGRKRQLEGRRDAPGPNGREFTQIYRHVAQRLAEAGQNVREGKLLGKDRCGIIAEAACEEWLDLHRRAA